MNEFISSLMTVQLDANFEGMVGNEVGGGDKAGLKRKRDTKQEEDELMRVPPVNDIYRARQQKRVHAA